MDTIMDTINDIRFVYDIVTDDRWEKGKKFGQREKEVLQKAKEEYTEIFAPISKYFYISEDERVVVDLFFGDYDAVKERILDKGAAIMADFGDVTKKIDEKLQK